MNTRSHVPIVCLTTAVLAVGGGCSSKPQIYRLYDGPDLPVTRIVRVRMPDCVKLVAVDGKWAVGLDLGHGWYYHEKELHIPPGTYRLAVQYMDMWDVGPDDHEKVKSERVRLVLDGKAGDVYAVRLKRPRSYSRAKAFARDPKIWIECVSGPRPSAKPAPGAAPVSPLKPLD